MKPELIAGKNGSRCLIVSYAGNDYDTAIEQAEKQFNLRNVSPKSVIALPENMNNVFRKNKRQHYKQLQLLKKGVICQGEDG